MNESRSCRSIDEILTDARARLDRVAADDLERERSNGAVIVDIRPVEQRSHDGALPGAIVIDRNVLEWRLDPSCDHHIPEIAGYDTRIVIVCNEGYSSSLAAAMLRDLGLERATDLIGGYQSLLARSETSQPINSRDLNAGSNMATSRADEPTLELRASACDV